MSKKEPYIDVRKAVKIANENKQKEYDVAKYMNELGKAYCVAYGWKQNTPSVISYLFKMKELSGCDTIDELISFKDDV